MGSPNYNSHLVQNAGNGRGYLHLVCRLADLAFRLIQNSNYPDEVKLKATEWRETCQEICQLADAAWAALPDGP